MSAVIVVGSGGREHALAWKLSLSPEVKRLIVAPGNAGFAESWERWELKVGGGEAEFARFADKARAEKIDLVVVGPDNPLADGIVDVLEARGLKVFGPKGAAARIESSKAFAKEVMQAAGVPTARYQVVRSISEARKFIDAADWSEGRGWVVKADGLALGKGVKLCDTPAQAFDAAAELILVSGSLVIEERLSGEELSWLALCDGKRAALLEPARDYKRLLDKNEGPNTGGMGAFSPVPGVTPKLEARVREEVFLPTLKELARRGCPFQGVLYAGLMWDRARDRYWVLEFNSRFGDPETQVLMPRVSGDLLPWLKAVAEGNLGALPDCVPFVEEKAVVVVGAAPGYPDSPEKGIPVSNQVRKGGEYFAAGVAQSGQGLVSSGGRVLGACGQAKTFAAARAQAYGRLSEVSFRGMLFRKDIAEGLE